LRFELKILFLNFEKKGHTTRGKWKNWKKSILKFELKFEKLRPYRQREMKKIEICHKNLK
jgi:hypothetical protein